MPLTDLVRYLNVRDRDQRPFLRLDDPFVATENGAEAHYARIRLASHYAPIYVGGSGSLHGHAAVLRAQGELNDLPLHPEAVFAIPSSNEEFVHLDRLVRTLHAMNYLLHPAQQHLHVRVNLRHIEIVPGGHGIVFENALRACGLDPKDISLEVNVDGETSAALHSALDAYRTRGYRIALAGVGLGAQDPRLQFFKPDCMRLDPSLLKQPRRLARIARGLADAGIQSLIEVSDAAQIRCASAAGVSLIQHLPDSTQRLGASAQHSDAQSFSPA